MRVPLRSLRPTLLLAALVAPACDGSTTGGGPGVGDLRLLVATRDEDALALFDLQALVEALDSPKRLPAEPIEARAEAEREIFVTSFPRFPGALAFDSRVFQETPDSRMEPGGFVAFDRDNGRIYLAGDRLAFFDLEDFSPLGTPTIDLGGRASDVVYDPTTRRVIVAVTRSDGPALRVFDAASLSEVPGSPILLPGGPGTTTGDLLLLSDRGQVFALLPDLSELAGFDPASLSPLPRTPVDLRVRATALTFDPQRERLYAGAADGMLEAVGATSFSLEGGFPRRIGDSVVDLAFDPGTQQLVAADSVARQVVVLDALTLTDEVDSPIDLTGSPVSVEVIDLR